MGAHYVCRTAVFLPHHQRWKCYWENQGLGGNTKWGKTGFTILSVTQIIHGDKYMYNSKKAWNSNNKNNRYKAIMKLKYGTAIHLQITKT
jgi:hypothetical protein